MKVAVPSTILATWHGINPALPSHAGGAGHVRCAEGRLGGSRAADVLRGGANARRSLLAPSSQDSTYTLTGSLTGTSAPAPAWEGTLHLVNVAAEL